MVWRLRPQEAFPATSAGLGWADLLPPGCLLLASLGSYTQFVGLLTVVNLGLKRFVEKQGDLWDDAEAVVVSWPLIPEPCVSLTHSCERSICHSCQRSISHSCQNVPAAEQQA